MKRISTLLLLLLLIATGASAKFTYWGYCDKDIVGTYGNQTSGKAAMYIPAEVAQKYVGLTVTGVRLGLTDNANTLKVFLSESLDGTPLAESDNNGGVKGNNLVKFDNPYTINGKGFYIGYEGAGTNAVIAYTSCKAAGSNFTNFGSGWTDNAANGDNALSITARIEGSSVPVDFAIANLNDMAVKKDTPFNITGKLMNLSATKVYSYELAYSIDGGEETKVTFDEAISERSEGTFTIHHNGISAAGNHKLSVRIVSVEGEEDAYEGNNNASCNLFMTSIAPTKRVLMEEFTGLMCGACPRGIVSIQKCTEAYPDNFIAIAKHNYYMDTPTELKSPTYDYEVGSTWPYCTMDRRLEFDPDPNTSLQYLNAILNATEVAAGVDAEANLVEGDDTHVKAKAKVQFVKNFNDVNFRLAFAIIEDGVTGYSQNNKYAGGGLGSLDGWESKGTMVKVTLNHVARMGYGVKEGIENSIPSNVNESNIYTYDATLSLPSTIRDRKNLKLVVMLLNKSTGWVENAVEVPVLESGETSVTDLNETVAPDLCMRDGRIMIEGFDGKLQVYTIGGELVANQGLKSGIYIVRGVNGKKSFVKRIAF